MYPQTRNYIKKEILKLIEKCNDTEHKNGEVNVEDIRSIVEEIENKELGPDCGNICDIVYSILCSECKNEKRCHGNAINHYKMLDCTLTYIVTNNSFKMIMQKKEE